MGRDKALLPVGGAPMARRVADALEAAGAHEVIALGGDLPGLAALGLHAVADASPGDGPFPATIHALELAAHPLVLVLSCDLVSPSASAMRTLVERLEEASGADGAVPVVAGHHQWTHAAWRTSAAPSLRAARDRGIGSLRRGTADLSILEVHDLAPEALRDADVPADLADVADDGPRGA
jgi:molybdopterin-guanine dinucleotide biosynthesis protein